MPITFSSPTFIGGVSITQSTAVSSISMGEIVRVLNSGSVTQTYDFVDVYSQSQSINLSAGQIVYNLEKSGSLVDSFNTTTSVVRMRLLITASVIGNAFTEQLITTTGAGSWTKPSGVTEVIVECWGAGAGGGGCSNNNTGAGGGGAGQYSRKLIVYGSSQQSVSYSIGDGGIGGSGANSGNVGGDTTWNTSEVVAKGGQGGAPNGTAAQTPAAGGNSGVAGSVGDVIHITTSPSRISDSGFYDARAPGTSVAGKGASAPGSSGQNNTEQYGGSGGGQIAITSGGQDGNTGSNYAAGGSGAAKVTGPNRSGGNGAQGLIRLIYR